MILSIKIPKKDVLSICKFKMEDNLVKGVVDISNRRIAIDASMHVDLEQQLLKDGSEQSELWGFNIYPHKENEDFIEFDSIINLRPWQNNRKRYIEDDEIKKEAVEIILEWVLI